MDNPVRKTKTGATLFPYYRDESKRLYFYLLERGMHLPIDQGLINGSGGKIEALTNCENALQAAKRELEEETGFVKEEQDFEYLGHIHFVGGYKDDWISFFFRVPLTKEEYQASKEPRETGDGKLVWLSEEEFRNRKDIVPDLLYVREDIIKPCGLFFMTAMMTDGGRVVKKETIGKIPTQRH